jgi:hypothetical protein
MGKINSVMVLVAVSLLIVLSVMQVSPALGSGTPVAAGTTIFVEPDQLTVFENHTYVVNVRLNDVVGLAGWQFELYWNSAMLSCINATVNTPAVWGGVGFDWFNKTEADASSINLNSVYTAWQFGPGIDNNYDATQGRYFKAECFGPHGGPYENTFNGSMSLVTLTFKAIRSGTTALTLANTELGNSAALPIAHTVLSGSKVSLVPGETEAPQTGDEPVKVNNQYSETNVTVLSIKAPLSNETIAPLLYNLTCTFPIEAFPVNLTLTPPIVVSPG